MATTITLTTKNPQAVQGGYTGTFTFTLTADGAQPATIPITITQPQPSLDALDHAAWQGVAGVAGAWAQRASNDGQAGGSMDNIDHVVVLMLENRGFDHVLGWLYEDDAPAVNIPPLGPNQPAYVGLAGADLDALANKMYDVQDEGEVLVTTGIYPPVRGARTPSSPLHNPHESYKNILADLFTQPYEQIIDFSPAKIDQQGYVLDYSTHFHNYGSAEQISEIMDTYAPEQLPVLNGLAKHYGVSDQWFCSVPSQTNTNRAFLLAGTARGMVKNGFYPRRTAGSKALGGKLASDQLPADTRTIFDVLEENGKGDSWMLFWQANWPPTAYGENQYVRIMFPKLLDDRYDARFAKLDNFYDRCALGTLPAISILEPEWGGGEQLTSKPLKGEPQSNGNDYHPVSDTTKGEDFVLKVYNALATGPKWGKTLLLITFDENGGTYDHVPPPAAIASSQDKAPSNYQNNDLDPQTQTQFGFRFNYYGVRVPAIAVSPWIAKSTVFRSGTATPFDHTSVIATILKWQKIDPSKWNLGQRTAAAPTFDTVIGGQQRDPTDAQVGIKFGAPPRRAPNATALTYGATFKLKYIGNKWPYQGPGVEPPDPPPGDLYVGPATQANRLANWFPSLAAEGAIKLQLTSATKTNGAPVGNNDIVQLVTTEASVGTYNTLGAWSGNHFLYYYTVGHSGQDWELRLPSYRVAGAPIYLEDEVIFLSRAFPYQRLTADLVQPDYLTTRFGEWAYWKLVPL
ncbi:MAG: hypothetical protein IPL61_33890 [Myxococcales bacterium]|nr:hypothetical protein [Myxococcales bacterium]